MGNGKIPVVLVVASVIVRMDGDVFEKARRIYGILKGDRRIPSTDRLVVPVEVSLLPKMGNVDKDV